MGAEAESGGRERDTNSWDALIERPVRCTYVPRVATIRHIIALYYRPRCVPPR